MLTTRTETGRHSRTVVLQILHIIIQLPVFLAGVVEVMPPPISSAVGLALAVGASIATTVLRYDTDERMGER